MADKTYPLPDGTLEGRADLGANVYATKFSLGTALAGEDLDNDFSRVGKPAEWAVPHVPAVNTAATISKAAGAEGVQHVCTGIVVTFASDANLAAVAKVSWALRDGATGAGTVLLSGVMSLPNVAGTMAPPVILEGLWIPGTAATAMTLEFSGAGGAGTFEAVSLIGVDVVEAA